MTNIFLQILNASITASWLIGAVVLVRFAIKRKAPRWIMCLLWGLVAVRLVLPFEVESAFSLVPETPKITLEVSEESTVTSTDTEISTPTPPVGELGNTSRPTEDISVEESIPEHDVSKESLPEISRPAESIPEESEDDFVEESADTSMEESEEKSMDESMDESMEQSIQTSRPSVLAGTLNTPNPPAGDGGSSMATTASIVWLCGLVALAIYALVNYLLLKKRVAVFVPDERGFRRCESIDTPFVLGFFRPRIYLPYGLSPAYEPYILAHEQAHIRRLDHLVKPIAYFILAIHWFNPLVWLAYVLFCKDIEYACDEKVLENAAADIRKDYAHALLECASKRSFLAACPIAFGEVSVKERVKKTMSYKKPLLWVMILCIILCAVVAVLFCTSPADTEGNSGETSSRAESASQEQSTGDVLDASKQEESTPGEESAPPEEFNPWEEFPPQVPDGVEVHPLRSEFLSFKDDPPLFYASRESESWLYIPSWGRTVHLPDYVLDERSSGVLWEEQAIFFGTKKDKNKLYAFSVEKKRGGVQKKEVTLPSAENFVTTFCDPTNNYPNGVSLFVFATDADVIHTYQITIPTFSGQWTQEQLPLGEVSADMIPIMANYVNITSCYIAFQPATGTPGYFVLHASWRDSDKGIQWSVEDPFDCPQYDGLISIRPVDMKQEESSSKMVMTVKVELEDHEEQYITFRGETTIWRMDPMENGASYSGDLPPEKETTGVLVKRIKMDPESWLSLKPIDEYSVAEYAYLGLYGWLYGDGNGSLYLYDYRTLHCINSGESLPYTLSYDVSSVAIGKDRVYCLKENGSVLTFDISAGFSGGVLLEETTPAPQFADCSLYIYNGELLLHDYQRSFTCNLEGEPRKLPYARTAISSQKFFEYGKDGRYLIYNQGAANSYYCCGSDENGITLSLPGTGILYGEEFNWWEDPYLRFDKDGNMISRVIVIQENSRLRKPCEIPFFTHYGEQHTVIAHKTTTLRINEFAVENLIYHRLVWTDDGTCYLLAMTAEYLEIYHVTPGVTHRELTPHTEENSTEKEYKTIITLYRLDEEEAMEMLKASLDFTLPKGYNITEEHIPYFETSLYEPFRLRDDFLALFRDYGNLEAKLKTYGVDCKVKEAILLESALLPITIRIVTTDDSLYFIAVQDSKKTTIPPFYTYTFYTEEEYVNAFLQIPVTVLVNGKEIETHLKPVTYGGYADIPFIAVMAAMGAEIEWTDEYKDWAVITLGGNTCTVDTYDSSLWYKHSYATVSQPFDSKTGNEVILRSDVLQQFFDDFCPGAKIRIDANAGTVYITD